MMFTLYFNASLSIVLQKTLTTNNWSLFIEEAVHVVEYCG